MPIFFLFVGIMLIASAINDKTADMAKLFKEDLTGQNNFTVWIIAILAIGMLGYVKAIRPVTNAFLALLIVVMILANNKGQTGGFFEKFSEALNIGGGATASY